MKCPNCQFENREKAKFCNECGHKFEITCPGCGAANRAGSKFCDECGNDLTQPKEAPSIDYSEPQSYTPKFLVDKILTTRTSLEGERKLVTVLFADVANYTSMAEKLDPEEVHQIMDGCFKILMDEIHRYEGTINQFTGDGVMALFGAPVAHEDHAQRACHAALAIQKSLQDYGEKIEREFGVNFKMRFGLNSGPVIVGAIGDDLRMDYTAVGDTTNLASRMENLAEAGTIVVSQNTYKISRDFFEFESKGKVPVKGKEEAQKAYVLFKASAVETRISASVAKGLTRFVGRKKEMATLKEAFEKAQSGVGQVVGIVGEAGVGKSRLLIELRDMLPAGEYTYLEGRCLHFGGSMPYLPILDILRSYFDIKEGEQESVIRKNMQEKVFELDENLKTILPPLQELLSLKVEDETYLKLEPQQKKEKTFEALRNLFVRNSQDKPLILAVEDLHWIDKTSEEFLSYLIDWLANTSMVLLLLYRPEYTHIWGSKSYYSKIGVDQLSSLTSAELVQSILEEAEVGPELENLILNRSGGIPLFMEEFTHSLLESGTIQKRDSRYVLSRKALEIDIPDTIEGIIAARIDRLEENLKRTMQVASVIGRDFAFRILQTITGMKEELKSHMINLQGLEFIYEKRLFPELEYIFKHILTQEVAYNSLLVRRRKEIHENIGQAIEQIYAERLEEFYEMLAYHYSKGETLEKAAHYLKLSGIKATTKHSPQEAFSFYKEALNSLEKLPDSEENKRARVEICLLSFVPSMVLGLPEESLQIFEEGKHLAEQLGDEKNLSHFCSIICIYHVMSSRKSTLAVKYGEQGFQVAKNTKDISVMVPCAVDLSIAYSLSGQYFKTVDFAPEVVNLMEKTESIFEFFNRAVAIYPCLCAVLGYSMGALGKFKQGNVFCEKGLATASKIGEPRTLALAEFYYGGFYFWKGEGKPAIEHLERCIRWCEETKWMWILGLALLIIGEGFHFTGEFDDSLKYIERGFKTLRNIGVEATDYAHLFLSMTLFELGRIDEAMQHITKALTLTQSFGNRQFEGYSKIWLGRILAKLDPSRFDKAEESILDGIQILETLQVKSLYSAGYLYLGDLYIDTDQKEEALRNLTKAESMFKEMGMDYWLERTQEVLERL